MPRWPRALPIVVAFGCLSCNLGPQLGPAPVQTRPEKPAPPAPVAPPPVAEPPPLRRAGDLEYLEFVTAGADANRPLPMIVAIHGLGDTPHDFADLLSGFDTPARIIVPRGIDPIEEGEGWSWYPLRARDPDVEGLARGIERGTKAVAEGVEILVRERPTLGRPIVTGFSQGGMLSFALATHHPQLFSAAVPVGGWLPPPLWPKPKEVRDPLDFPRVVALHGDADKAVAIEPTREAVVALQALGLRVELHEYAEVGHMITPPMHEELFELLRESIVHEEEIDPN